MLYSKFSLTLDSYLERNTHIKRLVVAYSGGLDSTVLLDLAKAYCDEKSDLTLLACHVDHGIQSESGAWAEHCQEQCASYGCAFKLCSLKISQETAMEETARALRYQAFNEICSSDDLLLTAHHLQDQSETVLFRLLRAAGVRGLRGIPKERVSSKEKLMIFRPLLDIDQTVLRAHAKEQELTWVDDPSNEDNHFSRNFLRLEVLPKLRSRWPELDKSLAHSAELLNESQALLDELAAEDCDGVKVQDLEKLKWGQCLDLGALNNLTWSRQKNLLRYWVGSQSSTLLNDVRLEEIKKIISAGQGELCWKQNDQQCYLRCFKGALYFCLEKAVEIDKDLRVEWDLNEVLEWHGVSYQAKCFPKEALPETGAVYLSNSVLEISYRQGGERCQPITRDKSQSLKKLYQEFDIPPWERDQAPIFYLGDKIAGVSDFWLCKGFEGPKEIGEGDHGYYWQIIRQG